MPTPSNLTQEGWVSGPVINFWVGLDDHSGKKILCGSLVPPQEGASADTSP